MKKPEDILREKKYSELSNLVLICEAMEDYAREVSIVALAKVQKTIELSDGEVKKANEAMHEENESLKEAVNKLHIGLVARGNYDGSVTCKMVEELKDRYKF